MRRIRIPATPGLLAAAMLLAAAGSATAQDGLSIPVTPEQAQAESATIELMNRLGLERAQEREAREAARRAEADAQRAAWEREMAHSDQLRMDYERELREQQEAHRRALEDHARIAEACRRGDHIVCEAGWAARGLPPPPRR